MKCHHVPGFQEWDVGGWATGSGMCVFSSQIFGRFFDSILDMVARALTILQNRTRELKERSKIRQKNVENESETFSEHVF